MQRYLNKKYKLVKAENYDQYLRALKIKLFYRKMANVERPVVRLLERDGKFVFEKFSWFQESVLVFRPGVPFDETRIDGQPSRSVIDFEDNRMIHVQSAGSGESIWVWEFSDKYINTTLTDADIVCTLLYNRMYEK